MNLFLTRACDQGCAFCYARDWLGSAPEDELGLEALWPALEHYAALVRLAGPPVPGDPLAASAGTVNLLGGEPTAHPDFGDLVRRLRSLGLGVNLFTSGANPEVVRSVASDLWFVTINGRFAQRAPSLGVELARVCAHLPLRPGDDVAALLEVVAAAGLRSAVLAFAAPAGGAAGPFFTPDDVQAMAALAAAAQAAADRLGITIGWDCAPPRCVLPDGPGRCVPVPVLEADGMVSVCGGAYVLADRRRPLLGFDSLDALHGWAQGIYRELAARPSPFAACRDCPERDQGCYGMCLGFREAP
mgnify:CR=1 FL=1